MAQSEPPRPRKRPRQARSQMLVEAIQQACVIILEREGPEQLTTNRIANVAGINIASLYRYFPNKEAVLAEVFEKQIEGYAEKIRKRIGEIERLSHESLEKTLAAIIDMEIEQRLALVRMEPEFYGLYQRSLDFHRRTNELSVSLDNLSWEAWFPRLLGQHRERLRNGGLEAMSHIARSALEGLLVTALSNIPETLNTQALKGEILDLLLRYLLADPEQRANTLS
ncbi:MAG: TetR/AcrR family transcriptional regulator [Halioglobus sp.]|nr:TetR/AcrR family transcriptional regulator [Halioglobus sp.]